MAMRRLRQLIDSGQLGEVLHFHGSICLVSASTCMPTRCHYSPSSSAPALAVCLRSAYAWSCQQGVMTQQHLCGLRARSANSDASRQHALMHY